MKEKADQDQSKQLTVVCKASRIKISIDLLKLLLESLQIDELKFEIDLSRNREISPFFRNQLSL